MKKGDKVAMIKEVQVMGNIYSIGMRGVITEDGNQSVIVNFAKYDSVALLTKNLKLV